jgi:tripartite-type tricarboxylate transporter receptor subunit TctC
MKRRHLLAAPLALPALAQAQEAPWPNRPVKVVMPYAAGGPTDVIARLICDRLSQRLPARFVVENRTGAGGNIGASVVAKSPGDGYSFLFSNIGLAVVRALYANLDYNPTRELKPITIVAESPMVLLVPPNAPWRTLGEFVAAVRAEPGRYSYVSAGGGGALQLVTLLFLKAAGLRMEEVAYRGSAPAVPDLAAGTVHMMYDAGATGFPLARNGQARALAVSSPQRSPVMPDVPTMAESGLPDATFSVWQAFFAPATTPDALVAQVQREIAAVLAEPAVQQRLVEMGAERIIGNPPEEAQAFVAAEFTRWENLLREAGIKPQ